MRGKGGISRNVIFHCRITPAYAEKRSSTSFKISSYQDHPRLCGEKRTECYTKSAAWGSPPPMRGKVNFHFFFLRIFRITPAYAGKSSCSVPVWIHLWDHPRLCGEKVVSSVMLYPSIGSPPPMRGKGLGNPFSHRQVGITPAYAGKSSSFFAISSACWDHPRLCGEKAVSAPIFFAKAGSPPPMRGKACALPP